MTSQEPVVRRKPVWLPFRHWTPLRRTSQSVPPTRKIAPASACEGGREKLAGPQKPSVSEPTIST
jgi:hypothetical protein